MKLSKIFNYGFPILMILCGLSCLIIGAIRRDVWECIAGVWMIVAMGFWFLIPNDLTGITCCKEASK